MLGGTFDPPHLGHALLAHEAWWQLGLDEVRLVPTRQAPHKREAARYTPEFRARLVEAAVADHPGLVCSRAELDREGPSWTVDTLEAMAAEEPEAELWFVLGADQLEGFPRWREPERILAVARLAAAARGDLLGPAIAGVARDRVDRIEMPEVAISSSLVRRRLEAGQPVRYLVPRAVEELLLAVAPSA